MSNPFDDFSSDEGGSPFVQTEESGQDPNNGVGDDASTQEIPVDVPKLETPEAEEDKPEDQPKGDPETPETPEKVEEEKELSEDEIKAIEAEAEKQLAEAQNDPKSKRTWWKNAINSVYKPQRDAARAELERFASFGSPEEVTDKLNLLSKLETVKTNEQGIPERSTEEFVKDLHSKDPAIAYQLINDLSQLPSPATQGYTVLQEMFKQVGIDPTRLEEVKQFAANGYQLQQGQFAPPTASDLALIPEHLQATFSALSPDRRDDLLASPDHVRNESLEDAKLARDAKQRETLETQTKEQREAQETQQRKAQFKADVDTKANEYFTKSGESVFTTFTDSLAKHMSPMDSLMIANTVLNSFEPTLAGRRSQELLKAEGIEVDPAISTTIGQLEENARHIAYYEKTSNRPEYEKAVAKQVELQERLAAKGNKIVASLALKKANSSTQALKTNLAPPNNRHAAAGVGSTISSNGKAPRDFSDESYAEMLSGTGFGRS